MQCPICKTTLIECGCEEGAFMAPRIITPSENKTVFVCDKCGNTVTAYGGIKSRPAGW